MSEEMIREAVATFVKDIDGVVMFAPKEELEKVEKEILAKLSVGAGKMNLASSGGDTAKIVAEIVKILVGMYSWSVYGGNCEGCGHGPLMKKHIGAPILGHTLVACPCCAARKAGRNTGCGCEWTRDE